MLFNFEKYKIDGVWYSIDFFTTKNNINGINGIDIYSDNYDYGYFFIDTTNKILFKRKYNTLPSNIPPLNVQQFCQKLWDMKVFK